VTKIAAAELGKPLHAAIPLNHIVAAAQRIENPVAVINFDHRAIPLDSPLHKVTIRPPLFSESDYSCDVHIIGRGIDLSHHVGPSEVPHELPDLRPNDVFVQVGDWRQIFNQPLLSISVTNESKRKFRDDFAFRTGNSDFCYFPNTDDVGNLRGSIALRQELQKSVTSGLVDAGFSSAEVQDAFLAVQSEYIKASDRDFMLAAFKSDVISLQKETDLKNAIRGLFLQAATLETEWAFVTQIDGREVLVIKDAGARYPFQIFYSILDRTGAETAWGALRLPQRVDQQRTADCLATFLAGETRRGIANESKP